MTRQPLHGSARAALKEATDDVHRRMHRHPGLRLLAAGSIGLVDYRRILARFFGFYVVMEPLVRPATASERLSRDLQDLGLSPFQIDALPRCKAVPRLEDENARLGAAYVLEGASAGGRIMAERLASGIAGAEVPVRFLSGNGDDSRRWSGFVDLLEATLVDPAESRVAAGAARATFLAMEVWMKDWHQDHG